MSLKMPVKHLKISTSSGRGAETGPNRHVVIVNESRFLQFRSHYRIFVRRLKQYMSLGERELQMRRERPPPLWEGSRSLLLLQPDFLMEEFEGNAGQSGLLVACALADVSLPSWTVLAKERASCSLLPSLITGVQQGPPLRPRHFDQSIF